MVTKLKNKILNFVDGIIYIFKYGYRYSQSRKVLLSIAAVIAGSYIVYFYLTAVGRYEDNILVRFFTLYPFKGTIIILTIPVASLLYAVKKIIEITMVSESIKKNNVSELKSKFSTRNSKEILELVDRISRLEDSYQEAVEHTLKNERLKTELISNVSHDLRTPLTSIINYVNILGQDGITETERKEYIGILDKKSKKLKVLIDDLFEMSKINSGKMEINKQKIDIMSMIHQAIGEYSSLYENKNIEFHVNTFEEEIFMMLDGQMMSRVFENIVINALKYSLENTRVYVDVIEKDDFVQIEFKNIANYYMDFSENEMFERFARGDGSRNSNVEGSGLGLAITKSIIELHNGSVNIIRDGDMFKIVIDLPKDLS